MDQSNAEWLGLKGRICVVTGAGSGIGRAVALAMASAGASVVLLDKDAAKCQGTAEALQSTGVMSHLCGLNTSESARSQPAIDQRNSGATAADPA